MKRLLVIVVLVVLMSVAGWAQDNQEASAYGTGLWLHNCWLQYQKLNGDSLENLSPPEHAEVLMKASEYQAFMLGIVELGSAPSVRVLAIPRSVRMDQIWGVVGKYLDDHPEEWNQVAYTLAYKALSETWPPRK